MAEYSFDSAQLIEYAEKIKNAFESGVWIWHTGIGNVGNFNLNNELPE